MAVFLAACGGGEPNAEADADAASGVVASSDKEERAPVVWPKRIPSTLWQPPAGSTPAAGSYIYLESEAGDPVGDGRTQTLTPLNSVIEVVTEASLLRMVVREDVRWIGNFVGAANFTQIKAGYYPGLQQYGSHDPRRGGLSWSGAHSCMTTEGWFAVDRVVYDGATGALQSIELRFEQHCGDISAPALRGKLRWLASDTRQPPGPVRPPLGLWRAPASAIPETGNYVYLDSEPNDYVGGGGTYLYTPLNSVLVMEATDALLRLFVNGDEFWSGYFQAMAGQSSMQAGYYANVGSYPAHNPALGGLSWSGEGRNCNAQANWFVIDSITYDGSTLTSVTLRFEQRCLESGPALHGQIRWSASDTTVPPGPVVPVPADLWQPPAGSTPASGNYVYLQSDPGDYVGQGRTYLYTQADALLIGSTAFAAWQLQVEGNESWLGNFVGMSSLPQLEVGYYGHLSVYDAHNPAFGGLAWQGGGGGCREIEGWMAIDSITVTAGVVTAIELRFEQHCEGATPALRGKLRWSTADTTTPPGPVNPPPAGLWTGPTPVTGTFVYLESEPGEFIGQGQTYLYTPATDPIVVSDDGRHLGISVGGWRGDFMAMTTLTRFEPGYYGGLQSYGSHNPTVGGLNWSGNGRNCEAGGWLVVDAVTYDARGLRRIDLRFEQRCVGQPQALHGRMVWSRP